MLFVLILGHFWCSVITSVIFISHPSNFKNNQKKISKNSEKSDFFCLNNSKKSDRSKKNHKKQEIQKTSNIIKKKLKCQKTQKKLLCFKKSKEKKLSETKKTPLCFSILGICNSTRALQSSSILRKKSGQIWKNLKIKFFSSKNL